MDCNWALEQESDISFKLKINPQIKSVSLILPSLPYQWPSHGQDKLYSIRNLSIHPSRWLILGLFVVKKKLKKSQIPHSEQTTLMFQTLAVLSFSPPQSSQATFIFKTSGLVYSVFVKAKTSGADACPRSVSVNRGGNNAISLQTWIRNTEIFFHKQKRKCKGSLCIRLASSSKV